jgi:hypothetical protein
MRRATLCILLFILTMTSLAAAETARVISKENAIRADTKFFAPVRVTVQFKDVLTVLGQRGDWYQVRFKGVEGYIHKSALEEKSFSFGGGSGGGQGASKDEVALAGKGFNPDVERAYGKKHPTLSFQTVDRIEQTRVPVDQLEKFIVNGGLNRP